jgi:hypothetical protein
VLLDSGQVLPTGKPPGLYALELLQRQGFIAAFLEMCLRQGQQRADLLALRGILALEAGDTKAAEDDLRASLALVPYFNARSAAEGYLELIEAARKK